MQAARLEQPRRRMVARLVAIAPTLAVLVITVTAFTATAPARAAGGPGTNIGNAALLTGTTTGSLPSASSDDWYVVYPSQVGGTVTIQITNTVQPPIVCSTTLIAAIDNANGAAGPLVNAGVDANTTNTYSVSWPGSTQYYVELSPGCSPAPGPVTYSLEVVSGGGGTPPSLSVGSVTAGASIGTVGSPLQGQTIYQGSIASSTTARSRTRVSRV